MSLIAEKNRVMCGSVSREYCEKKITVKGWVSRRRDHGNVVFVDLRDRSGVVQVVFDPSCNKEAYEKSLNLRLEYVLEVEGMVKSRTNETVNTQLGTGNLEIHAHNLIIQNSSKALPFSLEDAGNIDEELRLSYRYIDLRRPAMHKNMAMRHKIVFAIRKYMDSEGFYEIETPMLTRNTPEGAREFIVPTRFGKGYAYSLPQSPQLYKQLLMAGGMERYFQIARCFRDEDLRADRQFEFTQLDIEMSFTSQEMIQTLIEGLLKLLFKEFLGVEVSAPFERMTYKVAFDKYGSDKPDLRLDMPILHVESIMKPIAADFIQKIFKQEDACAGMLVAENKRFTRSELDTIVTKALEFGAKGLLWIRLSETGAIESPIAKFLPSDFVDQVKKELGIILNADHTLFVMMGEYEETWTMLGRLRLFLGNLLSLMKNEYRFLWVTDFPLFEYDKESKSWNAVHHPFTRPSDGWEQKNIKDITAIAYDVVLNGIELGGGSMRIYERDLQEKMFDVLGLDKEKAYQKFGFLLDAQEYGFPQHGGIALGIDRLIMLMLNCSSIRDVIAFPKVSSGFDPLTKAPTEIENSFLKFYGLQKVEAKK